MHKDVRQLKKAAKKQGLVWDDNHKHPRVYRKGKPGTFVVVPRTPSDHRALKNTIAQMRKLLGFKWKGR